jgi:predicted transposase YdaD
MPITYDIKTDFLFQEGARSKTKEIIENMLKAEKLTIEEIASIVGVTVEYVEEIQREGNKK